MLGIAILVAGTLAITFLGEKSDTSRLRVEEGESLSRLFARAELPDGDLLAVMEAGHGAAFRITLVPGAEVRIDRRNDGRLGRLTVVRGSGETTEFVANDAGQFTISSRASAVASPREAPTPNAASDESLTGVPLAEDAAAPAPEPATDRSAPAPLAALEAPAPDATPAPARPLARDRSPPANGARLERVAVRNGDSLYLIFRRNGLPQGDLHDLVSSGREGRQLKRLRPANPSLSRGDRTAGSPSSITRWTS